MQIATNGADDYLARVQPDADLDGDAMRAEDTGRVPPHALLHAEGSVTGADGVIFLRDRRAEQRHDAVAHHLVDGPLVAVDGLHHAFQDGVEKLASLLGIAVGEQLHRALEVGEEDRDLLTLAFQGCLRGKDLLGEVLRRIRLRGRELGCRASPEWRGALAAELILGRVRRATGRTGCGKRCGALPTELHA